MIFRKKLTSFAFLLAIIVSFFLLSQIPANAQENYEEQDSPVFFYYFYSSICPFCNKVEENFFPGLKERNPELRIRKFNVSYYGDFFINLSKNNYNITDPMKLGAVPAIFIGEHHLIGMPGKREEKVIEEIVQHCLIYGCLNPQDVIFKQGVAHENHNKQKVEPIRGVDYITLPFVGEIYIADFSFPVITILIAAADGFNPCALWVLMFLILLVLKEPSRKRLILIVGTFILVSGIFYFFLLSAWLQLFLLIGYIRIIQLIIGTIALGVGIWQVKTFFNKGTATCKLSKKGAKIHNIIAEKVKKVIAEKSVILTIIGVSVLAVMVNFFEFICSAGFPAIWSSLLALQGFDPIYNYLFILLYVLIFMLDQIIIFTIALIALKVTTVGDKITKWTGLIGGLLMIILGLLILFRPEWLIFA